MQSISDLLLRYSTAIPGLKFSEQRRVCAEEASIVMNYPFTSKDTRYKNEELSFSVPPVLKSALYLKQNELIQKLALRGITVKVRR
jgi:hypothetical protein